MKKNIPLKNDFIKTFVLIIVFSTVMSIITIMMSKDILLDIFGLGSEGYKKMPEIRSYIKTKGIAVLDKRNR